MGTYTLRSFKDAVEHLRKKGDHLVYHIGFLFVDRASRPELNSVADEAWRLAKTGAFELKQRRLATGLSSYIITRR